MFNCELKVELTFTEPVLGTSPADKNIYLNYIASQAPSEEAVEEELENLDAAGEEAEKKITVFARDRNDRPILYDYQIKGFFKDSCGGLRMVKGTASSGVKAYKKLIDKLIFIKERQIPLQMEGALGYCQRSLRANTPKGERTSLAMSEEAPAGTRLRFTVQAPGDAELELVKEWLDYGKYSGIGQWRNSGKGRFTWREVKD